MEVIKNFILICGHGFIKKRASELENLVRQNFIYIIQKRSFCCQVLG